MVVAKAFGAHGLDAGRQVPLRRGGSELLGLGRSDRGVSPGIDGRRRRVGQAAGGFQVRSSFGQGPLQGLELG
ncbi:MAG: hypothetical protein E6I08_07885 [Chloroflexi bacterium]|nr:MAG: hypothetical protein E6I08_07885 [Chloroflexota bacterium]